MCVCTEKKFKNQKTIHRAKHYSHETRHWNCIKTRNCTHTTSDSSLWLVVEKPKNFELESAAMAAPGDNTCSTVRPNSSWALRITNARNAPIITSYYRNYTVYTSNHSSRTLHKCCIMFKATVKCWNWNTTEDINITEIAQDRTTYFVQRTTVRLPNEDILNYSWAITSGRSFSTEVLTLNFNLDLELTVTFSSDAEISRKLDFYFSRNNSRSHVGKTTISEQHLYSLNKQHTC